jgi:DeoD family purine-nucleoside phosphorylase
MPDPIHLHPTAELAERVLVPGDPGRALRLAQQLMPSPKMFNHNRGLWGYTGEAHDDELLTIQSTGMGGPSAAIVVSELIALGARRIVRVGTCGGLDPSLSLGQLVIATEAVCADGTSRALGAGERAPASPALLASLLSDRPGEAPRRGPVVSTDLFYDAGELKDGWVAAGAIAVEMEAAALFTLAARRGVEAGCALLVSDLLSGGRERIATELLHGAELRLGELALAALAA